jgi:RNase P subunit RPR2
MAKKKHKQSKVEPEWLVCALPGGPEITGSKHGYFCEKCARSVVIAPSGQKLHRERKLHIMCLECAIKMREENQDEFQIAEIPEHTAEVLEELRSEVERWKAEATEIFKKTHRN